MYNKDYNWYILVSVITIVSLCNPNQAYQILVSKTQNPLLVNFFI